MAARKSATRKKKTGAKRAKRAAKKKRARKRASAPAKTSRAKKKTARKKATRKKAARKKAAKKRPATKRAKKRSTAKRASLGRPRIPADAKLDHVFQKDYQAREIFEFLGVTTMRELEQHPPDEIIEKLTGPMIQTVQRIRKTLAMANRCLSGDKEFALEFKSSIQGRN